MADAASKAQAVLNAVVAARKGGEHRAPQVEMTRLVAEAAVSRGPLIVQAGTGTGKSLAYLCAAVGADAKVVISTATKQLSDQLLTADVPQVLKAVKKVSGRRLQAASLKGRANYVCLNKVEEILDLDAQAPPAMVESELDLGIAIPGPVRNARPTPTQRTELRDVLTWAQSGPVSGDRVDGPSVSDATWAQVSMDSAGCPGARVCPQGEDCLAELARFNARKANVVVINHALLAQDLISPGPLFDDRDLIIVDEVHELQGYLSNAWGHEISATAIDRVAMNAMRRVPKESTAELALAKAVLDDVAAVNLALSTLPAQLWKDRLPMDIDGPLASLEGHADDLSSALDRIAKESTDASAVQSVRGQLTDLVLAISTVRTIDRDVVRWSEAGRDDNPAVLKAALLEVGPKFHELLGKRGLVATSATASVGGDFTPVANMLGLTGRGTPTWEGVDVGSPFDYRSQAILYVPRHLPEPVGKDRADHTAAVLAELVRLVDAAGGRTLALFTTTQAARNAGDFLRKRVPPGVTVLTTGELPAAELAEEFTVDETSVLCATMGMWSGLNVKGPSCTLVVIDKIPFPPMDDPLAASRRNNADANNRNGFREVFVDAAALMLTQGTGRLIRARDDKGVVAILDARLHTKGYGPVMLSSLPPMWRTTDPDLVYSALRRLALGDG